jgi:hypothetical protein
MSEYRTFLLHINSHRLLHHLTDSGLPNVRAHLLPEAGATQERTL